MAKGDFYVSFDSNVEDFARKTASSLGLVQTAINDLNADFAKIKGLDLKKLAGGDMATVERLTNALAKLAEAESKLNSGGGRGGGNSGGSGTSGSGGGGSVDASAMTNAMSEMVQGMNQLVLSMKRTVDRSESLQKSLATVVKKVGGLGGTLDEVGNKKKQDRYYIPGQAGTVKKDAPGAVLHGSAEWKKAQSELKGLADAARGAATETRRGGGGGNIQTVSKVTIDSAAMVRSINKVQEEVRRSAKRIGKEVADAVKSANQSTVPTTTGTGRADAKKAKRVESAEAAQDTRSREEKRKANKAEFAEKRAAEKAAKGPDITQSEKIRRERIQRSLTISQAGEGALTELSGKGKGKLKRSDLVGILKDLGSQGYESKKFDKNTNVEALIKMIATAGKQYRKEGFATKEDLNTTGRVRPDPFVSDQVRDLLGSTLNEFENALPALREARATLSANSLSGGTKRNQPTSRSTTRAGESGVSGIYEDAITQKRLQIAEAQRQKSGLRKTMKSKDFDKREASFYNETIGLIDATIEEHYKEINRLIAKQEPAQLNIKDQGSSQVLTGTAKGSGKGSANRNRTFALPENEVLSAEDTQDLYAEVGLRRARKLAKKGATPFGSELNQGITGKGDDTVEAAQKGLSSIRRAFIKIDEAADDYYALGSAEAKKAHGAAIAARVGLKPGDFESEGFRKGHTLRNTREFLPGEEEALSPRERYTQRRVRGGEDYQAILDGVKGALGSSTQRPGGSKFDRVRKITGLGLTGSANGLGGGVLRLDNDDPKKSQEIENSTKAYASKLTKALGTFDDVEEATQAMVDAEEAAAKLLRRIFAATNDAVPLETLLPASHPISAKNAADDADRQIAIERRNKRNAQGATISDSEVFASKARELLKVMDQQVDEGKRLAAIDKKLAAARKRIQAADEKHIATLSDEDKSALDLARAERELAENRAVQARKAQQESASRTGGRLEGAQKEADAARLADVHAGYDLNRQEKWVRQLGEKGLFEQQAEQQLSLDIANEVKGGTSGRVSTADNALAAEKKKHDRATARNIAAVEAAERNLAAAIEAEAAFTKNVSKVAKANEAKLSAERLALARAYAASTSDIKARIEGSGRGNQGHLVTQEEFDKKSRQLASRGPEARNKLVQAVSNARDEGDLKENAGYHAAREALGQFDGKVKELVRFLNTAVVGTKEQIEEQVANQAQRRGLLEPAAEKFRRSEERLTAARQTYSTVGGPGKSLIEEARVKRDQDLADLEHLQSLSPEELAKHFINKGDEAKAARTKKDEQIQQVREDGGARKKKGGRGSGSGAGSGGGGGETGGTAPDSGDGSQRGLLRQILAAVNRVNATLKGGVKTTGRAAAGTNEQVSASTARPRHTISGSLNAEDRAKRAALKEEREGSYKELASLKGKRDRLATKPHRTAKQAKDLSDLQARIQAIVEHNDSLGEQIKQVGLDAVKRERAAARTTVTQSPAAASAKRARGKGKVTTTSDVDANIAATIAAEQANAKEAKKAESLAKKVTRAKEAANKAAEAALAAEEKHKTASRLHRIASTADTPESVQERIDNTTKMIDGLRRRSGVPIGPQRQDTQQRIDTLQDQLPYMREQLTRLQNAPAPDADAVEKAEAAVVAAEREYQEATERATAARNQVAKLEEEQQGHFAEQRAALEESARATRAAQGNLAPGTGTPGTRGAPGAGDPPPPVVPTPHELTPGRNLFGGTNEVVSAADRSGRQAFGPRSQSASAISALYGRNGFWARVVNSTGTFIVRNFTAGFVFGATNALQEVVAQAIQTESTFVRVSNALEAGDKSLGGIRGDLQSISTDYGTNLNDVYETAAGLTGLFETVPEISSATRIASQLRTISDGAINAQEAIATLASITGGFKEDLEGGTEGFQHVADVMVSVQNNVGSNLEVTAEGVAALSGLAKDMKLSFEETAVYTAQIAKLTGSSGGAAGEKLGRILGALQTGRSQSAITEAFNSGGSNGGIPQEDSLLIQSQFNTGNVGGAIKTLMENWDNLTDAQKANISTATFGQRQMAAGKALFADTAKTLNDVAKATNSTGVAEDRMSAISKTLQVQIKKLGSNFQNLASALIQSGILDFLAVILGVTNTVLGTINKTLTAFNELADSNSFTKFLKHLTVGLLGLAAVLALTRRGLVGLGGALGQSGVARSGVLGNVARSAQQGSIRGVVGSSFALGTSRYVPSPVRDTRLNPRGSQGHAFFGSLPGSGRVSQYGNFLQNRGVARIERGGLAATQTAGSAAALRSANAQIALGRAQLATGNIASRVGRAFAGISLAGIGATAGLVAATYAITKFVQHAGEVKDLRKVIDAQDYTQNKDDTRNKGQSDKDKYVGPLQEATDKGKGNPGALVLGFKTIGGWLKGRNRGNTYMRELGREDDGAGGQQQYGLTSANKTLQELRKGINEQLGGPGLTSEKVAETQKEIKERLNAEAQKINDNTSLSDQQRRSGLASIEQIRAQLDTSLGYFAALAAGFDVGNLLNADQVKTLDLITSTSKALSGRGTEIDGVDMSGYMDGLVEKLALRENDPLLASVRALATGRLNVVDALEAERKILGAEVDRLYVKLGTQAEGGDAYEETKAALDAARDKFLDFTNNFTNLMAQAQKIKADLLASTGNFKAAANTFQPVIGSAYNDLRTVKAGVPLAPYKQPTFLGLPVGAATGTQPGSSDAIAQKTAEYNAQLQAQTALQAEGATKDLRAQLATTMDPKKKAEIQQRIDETILNLFLARIAQFGPGAVSFQDQTSQKAAKAAADQSLASAKAAENAAAGQTAITKLGPSNAAGIASQSLANANQAKADAVAQGFSTTSAEYQSAVQAQISAQYAIQAAQGEIIQANANLRAAYANARGNPVGAAKAGLSAANAALTYARKLSGGARSAEVINAQAAVVNARASLQQAKLDDQTDTIDFNMQMGRITAAGAIAQLQSMLKTEKLNRLQRRALLLKIKGLKDELSGDGQFNFGDIKLPTPYSVKRYLAQQKLDRQKQQAAAAGISNQYDVGAFGRGGFSRVSSSTSTTNHNSSAQITINGADTGKVLALIKQVVGGNVTVNTVQARRR